MLFFLFSLCIIYYILNMFSYENETYKVIGAAMKVHRVLGAGFLENVYQDALEIEFLKQKIPYSREVQIPIFYNKIKLNSSYRADFLCYNSIIVELKALKNLTNIESAQVINYLKATGLKTGLLLNFGEKSLIYKRLAL